MDHEFLNDCFGRNASDATCASRGILSFFPLVFIWLCLPQLYYIYFYRLKKRKRVRSSVIHQARSVTFLALIICEGAILFWGTVQHVAIARLFLAGFNLTSYVLSFLIYLLFRRRGQLSNGPLFVTFVLLAIVQFIDVVVLLFERPIYEQDFPIEALLVMAQTALLSLTEKVPSKDLEKKSPEEYAGFMSILFMAWLNPLVSRGAKDDLTMDDLYPLLPSSKSETVLTKWQPLWTKAKKSAKEKNKEPALAMTLFAMYRTGWIAIMALRLFADLLQFVNPLLLKYLIDFVGDPDAPLSFGIAIALIMFTCSEIRSFCNNHFLYTVIQYSVKLQSTLTNIVFRKTLKLSTAARNKRTVGEIVNFMAIDIEKMVLVLPFVHNMWSAPMQITIAMVFLCLVLGPSALGGVLIMICFIPINYFSSRYIKNRQIEQMKVKDQRTKMCNEILNGMKLIKLYAWEEAFEEKINRMREQEVKLLRKAAFMGRWVDAANVAAPFLVAMVAFATYVLSSEKNVLTPQKAFVSLTLFNQIRMPMRMLAIFINNFVQAMVSNDRLRKFLADEEMQTNVKFREAPEGTTIFFDKVNMNWKGPDSPAALSDITLCIEPCSLTAIVGVVGSGKSSLLSAALGEMHYLSGDIGITGSIAYAPQQPWLQNMTVRDNITYGKKFESRFYNKVVEACELNSDFVLFPHGDLTEVGENGITLSGGQKARLGLARAVYQESDIYLLDDILSAVDAHVGQAVFEKVIGPTGLLAGKTVLLVTHGLQYTKTADTIIVMADGQIAQQGAFSELQDREGPFKSLLTESEQTKEDLADSSGITETEEEDEVKVAEAKPIKKRSRKSSSMSEQQRERKVKVNFVEPKLMKKEKLETGRVNSTVYWTFIKASTIRYSLLFLVFMLAHYALMSGRSIWLSKWSDASRFGNDTLGVHHRLEVYGGFGVAEVVAIILALVFLVLSSEKASMNLHTPLLHAILRSPMVFFDTTPIGRVLNRLSRDVEVLDVQLPNNIRQFLQHALSAIMVLVMVSYSTPAFVIAVVPLIGFYMLLLHYFVPTSRQLKRLESICRSPIISTFSESIQGSTSIRAYDKVGVTCDLFSKDVDAFTRCRYLAMGTNRWLALRLEIIGNSTVLLSALLGVISTRLTGISPGLVGLSVTFALSITEQLNLSVRMMSDMETNIVCVERIKEYTENEEEMEWHSDCPPDIAWPSRGEIRWENYATRYREGLPLVVKGINAVIHPGEKVAVVGRTGSGKSSLTLGLFRLIEPAEGRIVIDNIDVYNIGLHDLRSKLTIIPQEPVLFSGTLRFNLDPFMKYTDEEHWSALDACQLREFVASHPEGLDYLIAEGGKNMSVGQRQLVCLGRALLRKGKILVLDEATAAVDVATDSLVQEVIRDKFADATVIAIAHRLNTVTNYDKIMVLDRGEIVEFDTPYRLLQDPDSKYSRMLEKSKTQ